MQTGLMNVPNIANRIAEAPGGGYVGHFHPRQVWLSGVKYRIIHEEPHWFVEYTVTFTGTLMCFNFMHKSTMVLALLKAP